MSHSRLEPLRTLSRHSDVLSTEVGGQIALMSIPNGCYYSLNSVASEIWRKLEQPTRVGQMATTLAAEYSGDPEQIENDLQETLQQWLALHLIEVSAPLRP
jgi:coenzyme PQQ synthesis protein D (PqqD)